MATLNERIKELRKKRNLSQKELAAKIGISQRSVSWSEQPGNNVPDSTIKSLCMAFGVREEWIRNGDLPMLFETPSNIIDQLKEEFELDDFSYNLVHEYLKLAPAQRKEIRDFFYRVVESQEDTDYIIKKTTPDEADEYKKSILDSAPNTDSTALNTTGDTGKAANE